MFFLQKADFLLLVLFLAPLGPPGSLDLKGLPLKGLALKAFDQARQCRAQNALLWYV
jgi:hypothetical protein